MHFQIEKPKSVEILPCFGGKCLENEYQVSNHYLLRNGHPYLYRMGELHFSRLREQDWETELLKMKQGGIEIVSTYLFWIHHEETEGEFCFEGNFDLSRFIKICKKCKMPLFLRIGPWAHGEARNGGFPDWLLEKCGGKEGTRCDKKPYLDYVFRYFSRVFEEIKEQLDVIIGIQVENELHSQPNHIETLLQMLQKIGFKAPLWTATGWGPGGSHAELPKDSLLPVFGGYPDAPWNVMIEPIRDNKTFHFSHDWNNSAIGTDVISQRGSMNETEQKKINQTPYLTCETGAGNQVTYHRRPIITADDVAAGVICALGSGVNGIGYYMYHGGTNPIGKTTMQESRATGYKNDYPILSYDFQSPIGAAGQLRESYFALRSIHRFLDCCGETLATMPSTLSDEMPVDFTDCSTLRCALRSDGERGFLFYNNHVHGKTMQNLTKTVTISLANGEKIEIPLTAPANSYGIIPFCFMIGTECVDWVTAMPVEIKEREIVFETLKKIPPKACLKNREIIDLRDGMMLGGVKIKLLTVSAPKAQEKKPVKVERVSQQKQQNPFLHIENRDGTPLSTSETVEFSFFLPENVRTIAIEAEGNLAALYCGDVLIDDQYLYGDEWLADVRSCSMNETFTLKILPFTEESRKKIYLETKMPLGVVEPRVFLLNESPKGV